jgi:hypothetical protein
MYVVDAGATAEAILVRQRAKTVMAGLEFRNDARAEVGVRSFRLATDVPSFRLSGFVRRGQSHGVSGRPHRAVVSV